MSYFLEASKPSLFNGFFGGPFACLIFFVPNKLDHTLARKNDSPTWCGVIVVVWCYCGDVVLLW